jgi:phage tail sheath gpL-like
VAISFNSIPSNIRIPLVAIEFDSSPASQGPALLAYRSILIGQKTTAGSAPANSLVRVTGPDHVIAAAGRGSILHRMSLGYFASNRMTETWIGVLADDGAGVAASGTITVTGPATRAGTIPLYLGGERVPVGVALGDSATIIAAAIAAAINANPDLPVTATAAAAVVTVTFRHRGTVGNSYDMRHSYRDGEALPAGVTLVFVQLANGTTTPSLTNLLAAMSDSWFQVWAHPYTDAGSLAAIETELAGRFGPLRMIDGVAVSSASGTFSGLSTLGAGRNSPHSVIMAQPGTNPLTPPMEFAAEVAGVVARFGADDPARPFQTLPLTRALPPAETDLFDVSERNLLLFDGISPTRLSAGGVVRLDRLITTYQTAASGADDTAYLDVTTMLTLLFLRHSFRQRFQTKYPRHKLAADGTRFGPGQAVMTPKLAKAEALGWFRQMEELGLVENFDQFRNDLVVERSIADPNRLELLVPPDLVNGLVVLASKFSFRL